MSNEFMNQTDELYRYLLDHDSITPMKALRELGIMRLASRISDLKKRGVVIDKEMVEVRAKNGRRCKVASYSIVEVKINGR